MTRIAVLGANGQVGAELCLLLAQQPGVEVVPVCRGRLGSAYLRYRGLACRHGHPADPLAAKALLGECDVIVNLALVASLAEPGAARATNAALIENVAACSRPRALHIYFSTMSVYGDRQQNQRFALRNSYAQDKWRTEKLFKACTRRAGASGYIFRLGHVCGELQGITQQIRRTLRAAEPIAMPDPARASNTVYVATLVDAILQVIAGRVAAGTYDLMNVPQWSWREVFEHEGRALALTPEFRAVGDPSRDGLLAGLKRTVAEALSVLANGPQVRRLLGRIAPHIPAAMYRTLRAQYAIRSARGDIQRLRKHAVPADALLRAPVGEAVCPALSPTAELLARAEYQLGPAPETGIWPADLPTGSQNQAGNSFDAASIAVSKAGPVVAS